MRIRSSLICVLLVLGLCSGCLPPPDYIDFKVGSKKKDRLKFDLADGDVRMKLLGVGTGSAGDGRYQLDISITVEYPRIPGQLQFDPWKIEVFLNDLPMSKVPDFIHSRTYRDEEGSYFVNVMFYEPVFEEAPQFLESIDGEIKIVLDDFVLMNGQPLAVDTVHAMDPNLP